MKGKGIFLVIAMIIVSCYSCNQLTVHNSGDTVTELGQSVFSIKWPGLESSGLSSAALPLHTYSVRIAVTADDITFPVDTTILYPETTGTLNIPVGSNRTFTALGRDAYLETIVSGSVSGVSIVKGVNPPLQIELTGYSEPSLNVTNFVGSGFPGSVDGAGQIVKVAQIPSIVIDVSNNIYTVQQDYIRKVTPQGYISIVYNAQGKLVGLYVDEDKNLYTTEDVGFLYNFIKISATGVRTVLSSNMGFAPSKGITRDEFGNFYISYKHGVKKITPAGTVIDFVGSLSSGAIDGIGVSARMNDPSDLAIDGFGMIYVTELGTKLRRINPAGEILTVIDDNRIKSPVGLFVDNKNVVYITQPHKILKYTPGTGISELAGDDWFGKTNAIGMTARFYEPSDIVKNSYGTFYIMDSRNSYIRRMTPE